MEQLPCIQKKRSLWDGSAVTWCGKRFADKDRNERWMNYNMFTRSDTCAACVRAFEAASN